ncbi:MAG TPA: hypothetical protein VF892_07205 [Pseudonocardiaceae bacterium]
MTYKASATREGRFWVIEVAGVGVTQGRTVPEAKEMTARQAVADAARAQEQVRRA